MARPLRQEYVETSSRGDNPFEKGDYISYANCGLPYYIGGVIAERDKLFVQTPDAFGKRFNIDVRTRSEVVGIDVRNKSVKVRTADGREYEETYDLNCCCRPVRRLWCRRSPE